MVRPRKNHSRFGRKKVPQSGMCENLTTLGRQDPRDTASKHLYWKRRKGGGVVRRLKSFRNCRRVIVVKFKTLWGGGKVSGQTNLFRPVNETTKFSALCAEVYKKQQKQ